MKRLRFGIVGTGNIAHRFAEAIQNVPNAVLSAVASRTREKAEKFGDEFGIPDRFESYEAMAKSDSVDVAYIAVPHSGHKDCSCLMLRNKKHVICEKPLAVTEKEAEEMFRTASENGVFLMEAMWARLVPGTLKTLDLVKEGAIGDVLGVEGKFCYAMGPDEADHHVLRNENGGGSLLDVGVYALSFASWYLGHDVVSVSAESDVRNGIDLHTAVLLRYKNGGIADLSSAVMLRKPDEGYIYGTEGYVHLPHFYAPWQIEIFRNDGTCDTITAPYLGNGFEEQIAHVCECIEKGLTESPVITREQTLYIMRQMDSIRKDIGLIYPQDKN